MNKYYKNKYFSLLIFLFIFAFNLNLFAIEFSDFPTDFSKKFEVGLPFFKSSKTLILRYKDYKTNKGILKFTQLLEIDKNQLFLALDYIAQTPELENTIRKYVILPEIIYNSSTKYRGLNFGNNEAFYYNTAYRFSEKQIMTSSRVYFDGKNIDYSKEALVNQFAKLNSFSKNVFTILVELDKHGFGYSDLKPDNIVLDNTGRTYLIDIEGLFKKDFFLKFDVSQRYEIPEIFDDINLSHRTYGLADFSVEANSYRLAKTYLDLLVPIISYLSLRNSVQYQTTSIKSFGHSAINSDIFEKSENLKKEILMFLATEKYTKTEYNDHIEKIYNLFVAVLKSTIGERGSYEILEDFKLILNLLSLDSVKRKIAFEKFQRQTSLKFKRCSEFVF